MFDKTKCGLGIVSLCILFLVCCGCEADNTAENIEIITQRGNYGYIDVNGDVVIEPQFYFAGNFSEGLAPVALDPVAINNDSYGYIDRDGELRIPAQFKVKPIRFCKFPTTKVRVHV